MAKYIDFAKNEDNEMCNGKPEWFVRSKSQRGVLGHIVWYPAWRQWVFETVPNTVWSQDCLAGVREFILSLSNTGGQPRLAQEKP